MRARAIGCSAALLLIFGTPVVSEAASSRMSSLFNQANQMNNEEQDMAKELKSKAGDNQALITMADTISGDHKANQSALEALASQKNITLESYKENKAAKQKLDNLNGAKFNEAFLNMDIQDHEKALSSFRKAKAEFNNDPNVRLYIDQTIPVLEAHLKMARNLHRDDKMLGSHENASNNESAD